MNKAKANSLASAARRERRKGGCWIDMRARMFDRAVELWPHIDFGEVDEASLPEWKEALDILVKEGLPIGD